MEAAEGTSLTAARGLLLAVPVLWATYNPALRFIHFLNPPSPAELSSVRMLAATVPFTPCPETRATQPPRVTMTTDRVADDDGMASRAKACACCCAPEPNSGRPTSGTACQAWGLEQTTATRAGFLLSTINVAVPIFAAAGLGGAGAPPVTKTAWAACALALLGVLITDAPNVSSSFDASVLSTPGDGFNGGDLGVLLGAACYAGSR